ncbi:MAG: hypothetical protein M3286_07850 [Thermoproteota archaeon]|nr:hypothetical protein [Thermoproteota archaeon]
MSQEEQQPPVEIIINGVIGWDERSITTNQPMQPEIGNLSKGKTGFPKVSRATLKHSSKREDYLTNIQIGNIRQSHGSRTTTYEYIKTAP